MLINRLIRLHIKSVKRNDESLFYIIFLVAILVGIGGFYWNKSITQLSSSPFDSSLIFIFTCGILLFNDYLIKCLHKRNSIFSSLIKCIPGSNELYTPYYLVREATSIWNLYLLFFFLCPIFFTMYDLHGITNAMMLFVGVFLLTILVSNMVFSLNMMTNKFLSVISHLIILSLILFLFHYSLIMSWEWLLGSSLLLLLVVNYFFVIHNVKRVKYWTGQEGKKRFFVFRNKIPIFRRTSFFLYISLHTRMILRSPILRRQAVSTILMTILCMISFTVNGRIMENYMTRCVLFSLLLLYFPMTLISFFATEGAFFDRLISSPSFRTFLKARYLECVLYSSAFFISMLFVFKDDTGILYLTALFFYCTGFILPLNFPRLFFAYDKIDISKTSKSWTSTSGLVPELYTLVVYIVTMLLVLLTYNLFSALVATHFMLWTGLICGIISPWWLRKIHTLYMKRTKYKNLENYRK